MALSLKFGKYFVQYEGELIMELNYDDVVIIEEVQDAHKVHRRLVLLRTHSLVLFYYFVVRQFLLLLFRFARYSLHRLNSLSRLVET